MELKKTLKKSGGVQPEAKLKAIVEETEENAQDTEMILDDTDLDEAAGGGKRLSDKKFR